MESYNSFRTFMMGCKGTMMFPNGVIYEGVSDEPKQFRGASAAMDATIPIIDRFLGISDNFPSNSLSTLLQDYKNYMPREHVDCINSINSSQLVSQCKLAPETLLKLISILDEVRKFRQTHWQLVVHYILEKSKCTHGSGGSEAVHFIPNQLLAVIDYIIALSSHQFGVCSKEQRG